MKKMLVNVLAVLCVICMSTSLAGCSCSDSIYCDPRGKVWYNVAELPQINDPFSEIYDGVYAITVEKNGRVRFTTTEGEVLEGNLTPSYNGYNIYSAKISVQFDNGKTASGWCITDADGRTLTFEYDFKQYRFSDTRALSEEEFATYRAQFIDFLLDVYETGEFPTEEEIAANDLYQQFTYYVQEDPCCGGSFRYDTLEKVMIESIEYRESTKSARVIMLNSAGEREEYEIFGNAKIANVKNGELIAIYPKDIKEGECLIYRENGREVIFCFEND